MSTLEYNGVKIFGDDSEILLEKSLDGGFHHFHVCCGCHKVHEVTMSVKAEGQLLSSHWLLPHPKESAKIISELQSVTPDLIQYELANERAADEIEHLKRERDIAVLDGAKILLELGDSKTEVAALRAFVGNNMLRSDYQTVDHMRAEIASLRAKLAAVCEAVSEYIAATDAANAAALANDAIGPHWAKRNAAYDALAALAAAREGEK